MTDSPSKNRQGLLLPILLPVVALAVIGLVLFGFSRVLLNLSKVGATVVALCTAAAIFSIVAYVASRKRVSGAALFPMMGAVLGVALMIGGVALVVAPKGEGGEAGGGAETVTLAAPVNAAVDGYQPTELTFKTGVATNLVFDNKDTGVPHNVVIFDGKDAEAPTVFEGAIVTGPATPTYQVPALTTGTYFFHCAVHPTTMTGDITVSEAGGGTGGGTAGGGLSISASGIQFNTDKLQMPADTAMTLTFDNQDAGVPHNFAVFKDEAYAENVFTGDIVTGPATQDYNLPALPAGTYYFKCDVHPTMKGTLEVTGGGGAGGSGGGGPGSASPGAPTPSGPASGGPSATPSG
jgi:plastocyanin